MDSLFRFCNNQNRSLTDCGIKMNLNSILIQCCYWKYGSQWNHHQDDGYFYQYIMEHAVDAEATGAINKLINDIEWIESKLRATKTVSSVFLDMKYCENYLRAKVSCFIIYR